MLALMVAAAGAAASTALVRGRRCVQLFLLIARQRFCSRGRRACLSPKQAERSAAEVDSRPIQASGAARERVLAPLIVRLPGFQAGPRRAPPSLVVVCIAATRFMGVAGVLGRPLRGGYGECARRLRRARGHVSGDARRRGRRGPHRRGRRGGVLSSYFPLPPPPCLRRSISMGGGRGRVREGRCCVVGRIRGCFIVCITAVTARRAFLERWLFRWEEAGLKTTGLRSRQLSLDRVGGPPRAISNRN